MKKRDENEDEEEEKERKKRCFVRSGRKIWKKIEMKEKKEEEMKAKRRRMSLVDEVVVRYGRIRKKRSIKRRGKR